MNEVTFSSILANAKVIEDLMKHVGDGVYPTKEFIANSWVSVVEVEKLRNQLQDEYERCRKIEKETASDLWREGARWNMKLIMELLGCVEAEKK